MSQIERLYHIDQMLHRRGVVPLRTFLDELGISRATFKRDLDYLRDRLRAPIIWDRQAGGYRFETASATDYEMPGLWFSASELYALLAAHKLLADIEPGILAAHIAPLQVRIAATLEASGQPVDAIARRVRLLSVGRRAVTPQGFADISRGLFERKRIEIQAWNRARDETNFRVVSPQRLIHYRDNWYLDAFCHWRNALRSFALDTLRQVVLLPASAIDIDDDTLDAHYTASYGIFAGAPLEQAVLRFDSERARWVRHECWHPGQQGEDLPDGGYRLRIPYADERELLMDILRHGRHVSIEAPQSLRERLQAELAAMQAVYARGAG
ncbi:MAG: helix-turn-helix transcriptional regulator [Pseudomonadota bacterium]